MSTSSWGSTDPGIELGAAVVLITGAGRGIGRATAKLFAARGAKVALGDLDLALVRELAAEIGERAAAFELDVSSHDSFAAFVDGAVAAFGPVDVLVNNAGVMPLGAFVDEREATSRTTLDVNVWGPILGMRLVLPSMIARRRGHVVNVASMAGKFPIPGAAVYVASKAAVLGLSAVVRDEVAPFGVSVSAVLPSAVNTGLVAGIPRGRGLPMVEPEDIARAIVRSCREPRAEIPVPAFMAAYDTLMALAPTGLVESVRSLLGARRVLTSLDSRARREYEQRVRDQTRPESRTSG